jgi:hypothetical protein
VRSALIASSEFRAAMREALGDEIYVAYLQSVEGVVR